MRRTWDKRKSPAVNVSRLGLMSRVNHIQRGGGKAAHPVPVVPLDSMDSESKQVLTELEEEAARPEKEQKKVVQPGERLALERLLAKWGDDWEAMSRDLKLNYFQYTPSQLRRKVDRMRRVLGPAA